MQQIKWPLLFVSGLVFFFSGSCATLSKQDCLRGDWYGIGYKDGIRGYPYNRLQKHKRACFDYGIMPDEVGYRKGWNDGLNVYCTEQKGYEKGHDIEEYKGSCPPYLEKKFLRGYLQGLQAAENNLYRKILRKNRELTKSILLLHELKGEERKKQLEKIDRLEHDIERLEDKFIDINHLRKRHGMKLE